MTRAARTRFVLAALVAAGASACTGRAVVDDAAAPESSTVRADGSCEETQEPFGDGPFWLQIAPGARLCARVGAAPITDELDRRARFVVTPGDHFLPLDPGAHDGRLSVCGDGRDRDYATSTRADGGPDATWTVEREELFGRARVRATYAVRVDDGLDDPPPDGGVDEGFVYELAIEGFADELEAGVLVDERPWPEAASTQVRHRLCRGASCDGSADVRVLASCEAPAAATERHLVVHDRGEIELLLAVEGARVDVVAARGALDGASFDVADRYWSAAARVSLEDFWTRDVALDLPPAVEGACRLLLKSLAPYGGWPEGVSARVFDCEDAATDLVASEHAYETLPPTP